MVKTEKKNLMRIEARRKLKDWYRTFPNVTVTLGNHDSLPRRQMRTA